jgi:hypothetical protein
VGIKMTLNLLFVVVHFIYLIFVIYSIFMRPILGEDESCQEKSDVK